MKKYLSLLTKSIFALVFCAQLNIAFAAEGAKQSVLDGLKVISAYAKPSLSGSNNSAAYISLKNDNTKDIIILDAMGLSGPSDSASSIANRVEMHIIVTDDKGVSKMVPVDRLVIPAGEELIMKPGGIHVMLLDLKQRLNFGDKIYVNFVLQDLGLYQVEVPVGKIN